MIDKGVFMFSVVLGTVFLTGVVSLVKALKARSVRPYFFPYLAVILTGFYGAVGLIEWLPRLLATNLLEASLNGVLFIGGLGVMIWGLSTFKQLQVEV
jgi:hypothetical protein